MNVHACNLAGTLLPIRLAHVAGVLRSDLIDARLDDELTLRYAKSAGRVRDLTQLIAQEYECCPFLSFDLNVPEEGDITLRIRGPPDARPILRSFLSPESRTAAAPKGDMEN